jgi:hypothetical protein
MIANPNAEATRPKIRVAVSVPAQDEMKSGFAYDLARMMTATAHQRHEIELRLHFVRDTLLPRARHDLVAMALTTGCTHILFLDSDMRFPKDTLVRLLAHEEPIVGVNYTRRRPPFEPTASDAELKPVYVEPGVEGLVPVVHMGLGVTLIDLDLFRQIPGPWFQIAHLAESGKYVGEDVYFMTLVREHGLSALVDNTLSREVTHLGEMEYSSDHSLDLRELARRNEEAPHGGDGSQ